MSLPSFTIELLDKIKPVLRWGHMLPLRQKTIGATARKAICLGDEVLVMRPFASRLGAEYLWLRLLQHDPWHRAIRAFSWRERVRRGIFGSGFRATDA
jgi:hypothetical protein